MYLSSDGSGGESLLWASDDDGKTWLDTGGRSAGRHTTFALLKDGRILGMGGKNTDIDGFMPKAVSSDGGKTYEVSKTPFPRIGSNQRPTILRLRSGRLFFASDFVHLNTGSQPEGMGHLGSYAALSDDEGETWHIKKLIGAQPHERQDIADRMKGPTLGYAVATQGPNGMIHLIATMTNPCLHFEMNEAWILDGPTAERSDEELMASTATAVSDVKDLRGALPERRAQGIVERRRGRRRPLRAPRHRDLVPRGRLEAVGGGLRARPQGRDRDPLVARRENGVDLGARGGRDAASGPSTGRTVRRRRSRAGATSWPTARPVCGTAPGSSSARRPSAAARCRGGNTGLPV